MKNKIGNIVINVNVNVYAPSSHGGGAKTVMNVKVNHPWWNWFRKPTSKSIDLDVDNEIIQPIISQFRLKGGM